MLFSKVEPQVSTSNYGRILISLQSPLPGSRLNLLFVTDWVNEPAKLVSSPDLICHVTDILKGYWGVRVGIGVLEGHRLGSAGCNIGSASHV